MAREARPFRDRNPVTIGGISLAVIATLVFLAFNAQSLPLIGGGTVYRAQFSEAAGLQPDDPVRVAGVKVGKVEGLALENGAVTVEFRVEDAFVGDRSEAAIKIETVLGAKYLALVPRGNEELDPDKAIPRRSTTSTPPSWPPRSRSWRRRSPTPRTRCAPPWPDWPGCRTPSPPAMPSSRSCWGRPAR
jgi:virulence factor Mce-like protein